MKRKSARKQAKGQSSSQKFDDTECNKSIIDIFTKRRDKSVESEHSAVDQDEPGGIDFDHRLINMNDKSILDTYTNINHDRGVSIFEP